MTCAEVRSKLEQYTSGQLYEKERRLVDAHAALCEGCNLELRLASAMASDTALSAPPDPEPFAPPESPSPDLAQTTPPAHSTPHLFPEIEALIAPAEAGPAASHVDPSAGFDVVFESDAPGASHEAAWSDAPAASHEAAWSDAPAASDEAAWSDAPAASDATTEFKGPPRESETTNWGFEPVDMLHDAGPPQESLLFAKEALARAEERVGRRPGDASRVGIWAVGGLAGVLLIGASVWAVLTIGSSSLETGASPAPRPPSKADRTADPGPVATLSPAPSVTPGTGTGADLPQGGGDVVASGGGSEAQAPSAPPPTVATKAAAPPPTVATKAAAPPPTVAKKGAPTAPSPAPRLSRLPTRTPPPPAFPEATTRRASKAASPATEPATDRPAPSSAPEKEAETPAAAASQPVAGEDHGAADPTPPSESAETPAEAESEPGGARVSESDVPWLAGADRSASQAPPMEPAPPAPAKETAPPESPIDRLSAATLRAETAHDLDALKRLKNGWKNALRSTVGPDRTRAKRELADCLWAIQILTGNKGDQRDALEAYRDYVLHAPAGGADVRTIARMRSLEDALAP